MVDKITFDNNLNQLYKSIRKPPIPPKKIILSKKDKLKKQDIKQGRKNWDKHEQ